MIFSRWRFLAMLFLFLALTALVPALSASSSPYFRILVIDQETGRGIPAVRVQTINRGQYWTDNNGVVAFSEPDLLNQKVWFSVESHGYVFESNTFGIQGVALDIQPGGQAVIAMRRVNLAQRLYRLTGSGMYRDSLLLGDKVPPIPEPGKVPVLGQDGGDMTLFKGRYYWLWGDTAIASFPLGIFQCTAAIADLPEKGGLDPDDGVILHYFRKEDGNIRSVLNLPFEGGKADWYGRPRVARDKKGAEHFLTEYARVDASMAPQAQGLLEYSEKTGYFELLAQFPNHPSFIGGGGGSTVFRHTVKGKDFFYSPGPLPVVRYPAEYELQGDIDLREAFTCLKEENHDKPTQASLERDKSGKPRWSWKKNARPMSHPQMDKLVKAGLLKEEERWFSLHDIDTGKFVIPHQGSVYWNPYRGRWVSIFVQFFGETIVGEVWYSEADTPQGPWVFAKKIITHKWQDQDCSFYLPTHLPDFDKNGGQTIYLKGSFSAFFGEMKTAAPRHDYNIMVYKLNLDDPRLFLPVPVYYDAVQTGRYGTKRDFQRSKLELAWFACDRPAPGALPVYQIKDQRGFRLTTKAETGAQSIFFALPADGQPPEKTEKNTPPQDNQPPKETTPQLPAASPPQAQSLDFHMLPSIKPAPLYEYEHAAGGRHYSLDASWQKDGWTRRSKPLCLVWPSPILFNPYADLDENLW